MIGIPGAEEVPTAVEDACVDLAQEFKASLMRRFLGVEAHLIVLVGSADEAQRRKENPSAGEQGCNLP